MEQPFPDQILILVAAHAGNASFIMDPATRLFKCFFKRNSLPAFTLAKENTTQTKNAPSPQ
jgi:hypothetical protein